MSTVHLQFSSLVYLSAFRRYSRATHWQIDLSTMSVEVNCSPKELATALKDFRADLITSQVKELHTQQAAVA